MANGDITSVVGQAIPSVCPSEDGRMWLLVRMGQLNPPNRNDCMMRLVQPNLQTVLTCAYENWVHWEGDGDELTIDSSLPALLEEEWIPPPPGWEKGIRWHGDDSTTLMVPVQSPMAANILGPELAFQVAKRQ
ncbi:hypothetical protein IFM89_022268 [Coptis chinensis]|uniref:Uncharacterized protein n=1 Tax=Coptis chinensis TaxID=261450 RepID=A0A835LMF2_9MAGN|nr:hypothetical protein IFM89_022268 [Coptis chinensis]